MQVTRARMLKRKTHLNDAGVEHGPDHLPFWPAHRLQEPRRLGRGPHLTAYEANRGLRRDPHQALGRDQSLPRSGVCLIRLPDLSSHCFAVCSKACLSAVGNQEVHRVCCSIQPFFSRSPSFARRPCLVPPYARLRGLYPRTVSPSCEQPL